MYQQQEGMAEKSKKWEQRRDDEAARKAERKTKLALVLLLSGKHWAYASSFPATPAQVRNTLVGTFWWGEAASTRLGAHRHSWRHSRWRTAAGSAVHINPAHRRATATRLMAVFHPTMAGQ